MISLRLTYIFLSFFLFSSVAGRPVKRGGDGCTDQGSSPCVCGGRYGIRNKSPRCPNKFLDFDDQTDLQKYDVSIKTQKTPQVTYECDHILELQIVASLIDNDPTCNALLANKNDQLKKLIDIVNNDANLVWLQDKVNSVKGQLVKKSALKSFSKKEITGAMNAISLLAKSAPVLGVAKEVDKLLSSIQPALNIASLETKFTQHMDGVIAHAKTQAAVAPDDIGPQRAANKAKAEATKARKSQKVEAEVQAEHGTSHPNGPPLTDAELADLVKQKKSATKKARKTKKSTLASGSGVQKTKPAKGAKVAKKV